MRKGKKFCGTFKKEVSFVDMGEFSESLHAYQNKYPIIQVNWKNK